MPDGMLSSIDICMYIRTYVHMCTQWVWHGLSLNGSEKPTVPSNLLFLLVLGHLFFDTKIYDVPMATSLFGLTVLEASASRL